MSRLTRDGTAEPVSRDQILRHARGQGNVHFPCSADHEQDLQPYPVDPYSAICDDHTYIHTYAGVVFGKQVFTSSQIWGQMKWTWASIPPAVRMRPSPAITSVLTPTVIPAVTPCPQRNTQEKTLIILFYFGSGREKRRQART